MDFKMKKGEICPIRGESIGDYCKQCYLEEGRCEEYILCSITCALCKSRISKSGSCPSCRNRNLFEFDEIYDNVIYKENKDEMIEF